MREEVWKLVLDFFKQDREKAELWMSTPNPGLGGIIPNDMLEPRHRYEQLREFVLNSRTLNTNPKDVRVFYFGCVREISGHYLYNHHGDRLSATEREYIPQRLRCPDGTFAPRMTKAPGQALLTQHEGWSVLSFWDYSIDHRPGSNSTFLINALVDFKDAMEYAKAAFPSIWTRFTFEVVQEKR